MLRDQPPVARKLATSHSLPAHSGRSKNILNYDRFTADDLADGVDITRSQSLADANTQYTPNEVGLKVLIPKTTLRRVADTDLLRKVGRMMENAYRLKEDSDGCAQFSSWTPLVGGAGTTIGIGHIAAAAARLDIGNNRSNPEPFGQNRKVGVLHPLQAHGIAMLMIPLNASSAGGTVAGNGQFGTQVAPGRGGSDTADEILRRGPSVMTNVAGVTIYTDANIAVDTSDDGSGAVFDPEGFVFVSEMEADLNQRTDDPSARSIEIVGVGSYVYGLWRPGASGVEVLGDCTLPTT